VQALKIMLRLSQNLFLRWQILASRWDWLAIS
jgi:hypothetical protein